jgi:hypothetical protein
VGKNPKGVIKTDEKEKKVIQKVLKEMKIAHDFVEFSGLKTPPVDPTLADWIKQLESLLK